MRPARRMAAALLAMAALLSGGGCFSERAFPIRPGDVPPRPSPLAADTRVADTRAWLWKYHPALERHLPERRQRPLLTEELVDEDGRAIDVMRHFRRRFEHQHTLLNAVGLSHTAQCTGPTADPDAPVPAWEGFEDVWVPVREGLSLSGRLGFAQRGGERIVSDCIVILPGLLGDLRPQRTRYLAEALRANGLHVLALELRGCGRTDGRHPNVYYNFGVLETGDLLAAAEWLQAMPEVRRTGLVGFCWGANHALLAAWEDGRSERHASVARRLAPYLRPKTGRRHYEAGVIAFSACYRFEKIIEDCERWWPVLVNPVLNALQDTIEHRIVQKGHGAASGSLRRLIEFEFARSELRYPGAVEDGLDYLRFLPHRGQRAGDKLESARVPVLMVHGANDPLSCAQDVADVVAMTRNPLVAAVVLPGGGHIGFAAYSRAYYYGLVLGFFDAEFGAAASIVGRE